MRRSLLMLGSGEGVVGSCLMREGLYEKSFGGSGLMECPDILRVVLELFVVGEFVDRKLGFIRCEVAFRNGARYDVSGTPDSGWNLVSFHVLPCGFITSQF